MKNDMRDLHERRNLFEFEWKSNGNLAFLRLLGV